MSLNVSLMWHPISFPDEELSESAARLKIIPGQKSNSLTKDFVCNFSKPRKLDLDPFAGNMSSTKAYFSVEKHCAYPKCE